MAAQATMRQLAHATKVQAATVEAKNAGSWAATGRRRWKLRTLAIYKNSGRQKIIIDI